MKKIIFLTEENPFPPTGGGKIRDANIIHALSEKMEVQIVCFSRSSQTDVKILPKNCYLTEINRESRSFFKKLISPFRIYILNGFSENMSYVLNSNEHSSQLLWLSRLTMAKYSSTAKNLGYKVILDEHNVESDLQFKLLASMKKLWSKRFWIDLILACQCRYFESRFCGMADAVVTTSETDANLLRSFPFKTPLFVIPNSIDFDSFESIRNRGQGSTLFFPGTLDYLPNIEGLLWFAREVMPILSKELGPHLPRVVVAGARPPSSLVQALEKAKVQVISNPVSMTEHFRDAKIVFVPLLSGSGTRLKILEAMASEKPVVSTLKGVEGIEAQDGAEILIGDSPENFSGKIIHLIRNPELLEKIGKQGAELARGKYDWRTLRAPIEVLLKSVDPEFRP